LGVLSPGSLGRLERLFARGVVVTTHYSGTGAAEMALAGISPRIGGVSFHSACDIDRTCQQVLLAHPDHSRAEHCFGDLCARPPLEVQRTLRSGLSTFQKRARRASTPATVARLSELWLKEAMQALSQWQPTRADACFCVRHQRDCPMFPATSGRYHLEISGINCQPWSCAGLRLGWLDDRSLPCLVLIRLILAAEPHGVCLECTPGFDFKGLSSLLQDKYTGDFAVTSPLDFGLPVARRRMYMYFDLHGSPPARLGLADMLPVSRRALALKPVDFLVARPQEVEGYYRKLLGKRARPPVPRRRAIQETTSLTLADVLCSGMWKRYEGHRARVVARMGDGCHIVDINHNPEYRGPPSDARVPTIMRSSTLVAVFPSAASDRLVLPTELVAMHGLELPAQLMSRLPDRRLVSLVGNSMHVAQVGCFLQFALAMRG